MATYKLIQDIEAEDHILGPLTLKQFIYALVAALCLYFCFIGLTKHFWPLIVIFLPVALFCVFFAFPFGKDQPTEVWALAKMRFLFKPRRRIWDQSGMRDLVTITAPKKIERVYTNGLSQTEVKSRLHTLADTIDSRGWAIKNVSAATYQQPGIIGQNGDSDRLLDFSTMPQPVPDYEVLPSDDILDEQRNPVAQQFAQMIDNSSRAHRQQLMDQLGSTPPTDNANAPANPPNNYWFLNQSSVPQHLSADQSAFTDAQVISPGVPSNSTAATATADEEALLAHSKATAARPSAAYGHMRTLAVPGTDQPMLQTPVAPAAPAAAAMTPTPDPAILELANNNDLNVATIARQANKPKDSDQSGEVVISLH